VLKYFISVGSDASPKTFRHDLCEVFRLESGVKASLYLAGEALEAENFYEGFLEKTVVVQLVHRAGRQAAEHLRDAVDLTDALKGLDGFFAGVVLGESLMVFRDHVGLVPVYVVGDGVKIVTNIPAEAKAWTTEPKPLEPATVADVLKGKSYKFWRPAYYESNAEELLKRLSDAVKNLCPKNSAVFFSGGLDSVILAKLLDLHGLNPALLTLGVKGSRDFERGEKAATLLGLEAVGITVDLQRVEKTLSTLKPVLGMMSPMDASIAAAMYILSAEAVSLGCSAAVSGQGADELFGGYRKYTTVLESKGYMGLEEALKNDFQALHVFGLPRDFTAVRCGGTYLLTPYLTRKVIEAATSTPAAQKIAVEKGRVVRKKVLREVCRSLGLGELAAVEKKALQYSSGLEKIVRKMV